MAHNFKKQFGQNFLRGDRYAELLVNGLDINANDCIFEIGPGDGKVTNILLSKGRKVISIEVDYDLIPKLIKRFGDNKSFELIHKDVMEVDMAETLVELDPENASKQYKLTGSLPYNISKLIIRKFLFSDPQPQVMSFIVQEEVAQDYVAQAPKASFLSTWIRLYAEVKKLESIPAAQFFPKPKVNGAILVITPRKLSPVERNAADQVSTLIHTGYSAPRKTLRNNLSSARKWEKENLTKAWEQLGLSPTLRPAETDIQTWLNLYQKLTKEE